MKKSSSELIKSKWTDLNEKHYKLRNANDLKVPKKPMEKCKRFSYNGSKLFNLLPKYIKDNEDPTIFRSLTKKWIWEQIPSI